MAFFSIVQLFCSLLAKNVFAKHFDPHFLLCSVLKTFFLINDNVLCTLISVLVSFGTASWVGCSKLYIDEVWHTMQSAADC